MKKKLRDYFQLFQEETRWNKDFVKPSAVLIGIVVAPLALAFWLICLPLQVVSNWLSN